MKPKGKQFISLHLHWLTICRPGEAGHWHNNPLYASLPCPVLVVGFCLPSFSSYSSKFDLFLRRHVPRNIVKNWSVFVFIFLFYMFCLLPSNVFPGQWRARNSSSLSTNWPIRRRFFIYMPQPLYSAVIDLKLRPLGELSPMWSFRERFHSCKTDSFSSFAITSI